MSATYDNGVAVPTGTLATLVGLDADGKGAVQGVGGALSPLRRLSAPLLVLDAGDSITQTGTVKVNGNWQYTDGLQEIAIRYAGPRFRQIGNAGIGGNTSAQLLARFDADVIAYAPDIVPIMIGTNDFVSGMSNAAIAALFDNIQAMVVKCLVAGALPVIIVPPTKNSAAAEVRKCVPYYYRLAHAWGVPLFDVFKLSVNPATGNFISGHAADGVHPDIAARLIYGTALGQFYQSLGSYLPAPYLAAYSETTSNNPANLLRNGSFAQQTTPGQPDGWGSGGADTTYQATTTPSAPFTGKEFVGTKTADGFTYITSSTDFNAPAGNTLLFSGALEVSGLGAAPSGLTLWCAGGGNHGVAPFTNWRVNGAFQFSAEMVVEASYTTLGATLIAQDAAIYTLRNLTVTNLTAMDAIWSPNVTA